MITLNNVNKYFNKNRKNQIHVINNTSLEFQDTGLVALLGPSGCGKTTLLNAIGGLDKIKKGSIYINDKKISSRFAYKVDKIRNLNVGYIFQDYKLIDNISVYDNVALVLKMLGIKDKQEIKNRVEYVLDRVGMLRYKYRPAGMLSGGERQRVGIARAIVKDPEIILADEPTGNLDSKNSLEVMNIIKAISKEKLIILVTHEEALAKFYASRIIEIQDGKVIKDYENDHVDDLDYAIDNRFYLKDFENFKTIKDDNVNIEIYSDKKEKLKLDIVLKNGNIYINSKTNEAIQVVDENSSIEFVNEHYKKIHKNDIDKYTFDFDKIIDKNIKKRYSSILNPLTLIIKGFKRVFDYPILKKILLIGFFVSAIFIMYSVSTTSATFNIKDEDFVVYNKNYLLVNTKKIKIDNYISYEQNANILYMIPTNSLVNFKLRFKEYYQTKDLQISIAGSLTDINTLEKNTLILGRMPENDKEIVVDKQLLKRYLSKEEKFQMIGITKDEDFLERELTITNVDNFKIVGISDTNSPSIYAAKNMFVNILANQTNDNYIEESNNQLLDYNLVQDKITLKEGRLPENDYETIVNITNKDLMPLNKTINQKINDKKLTVVGYYTSEYDYSFFLVNNNTIKYKLITESSDFMVYPKDREKALNDFQNLNLNIKDSYESSKVDYKKTIHDNVKSTLIVSGIILLISLVEIFLMIRSSFLSRIKEIGIYRAIGVKKKDIYKMFFGEIFAITTLASIPGLVLMAYILYNISKIKYFSPLFLINIPIVLASIIFVYLFNLLIGLLPVHRVVKKRPAEILSRHDLD